MRKSEKITNYSEYVDKQIERSDDKWNSRTFKEKIFYKSLLTALPKMAVTSTGKCLKPNRIICMGIRDGNEYHSFKKIQKVLTEIEDAEVYGVDINPMVKDVGPNCHAYDFTNLPLEWSNRFDFLYSNSLDHSFAVERTIEEWWRILQHDRFMLLALTSGSKVSATDIYDFEPEDCARLFPSDKFEIRHVWQEYGQEGFFNALIRIIK